MRLIEIEIIYKDWPPDTDWIPEDRLPETLLEISLAGLGSKVIGPVSWQRQLAVMENNPQAI